MQGTTHEYETTTIAAAELKAWHVLVGESGGLSAVYAVYQSGLIMGCLGVETEHGTLYLDPDCEVSIYKEDN